MSSVIAKTATSTIWITSLTSMHAFLTSQIRSIRLESATVNIHMRQRCIYIKLSLLDCRAELGAQNESSVSKRCIYKTHVHVLFNIKYSSSPETLQ